MTTRPTKPMTIHYALPGPQWHNDFKFAEPTNNAQKNFNALMANPSLGSSVAYAYGVTSKALRQTNDLSRALTAQYGEAVMAEIINTFSEGAAHGPKGLVVLHRVAINGQKMTAQNSDLSIDLPFPDDANV